MNRETGWFYWECEREGREEWEEWEEWEGREEREEVGEEIG
jgi:hypothetical protein